MPLPELDELTARDDVVRHQWVASALGNQTKFMKRLAIKDEPLVRAADQPPALECGRWELNPALGCSVADETMDSDRDCAGVHRAG